MVSSRGFFQCYCHVVPGLPCIPKAGKRDVIPTQDSRSPVTKSLPSHNNPGVASEDLNGDKMTLITVGVVLGLILLAIASFSLLRRSDPSGTRNSTHPITNLHFAYPCPGVSSPVKKDSSNMMHWCFHFFNSSLVSLSSIFLNYIGEGKLEFELNVYSFNLNSCSSSYVSDVKCV